MEVDFPDRVNVLDIVQRFLAAIKADEACVYEDSDRGRMMIIIPLALESSE